MNLGETATDPAVGHEERDTNIRAILWFTASLVVTIVVVLLLMRWAFYAFPEPQVESALSGAAAPAVNELPPEPRLQVHAQEDLKEMRRQEEAVLNSYGWIDRQNGIVRISIDRAMELLVQRGLPPLKASVK